MFCGNCGARYFSKGNYSGRGSNKRYYPYYYCYSRAKTNKRFIIDPDCKNPVYAIEKLDQYIIDEIKKIALNVDYFNSIRNSPNESLTTNIDIIDKRIKEIDNQVSRMLDLYQLGTIPLDTINSRVKLLQDEKKTLLDSKAAIAAKDVKLGTQEVQKILNSIGDAFEDRPIEDKRAIVYSLIEKIIVLEESNKFGIYWRF